MQRTNSVLQEIRFVCPHTDRAIDTGVHGDPQSLAETWDKEMTIQCPHCGLNHSLKIRKAFIDQMLRVAG